MRHLENGKKQRRREAAKEGERKGERENEENRKRRKALETPSVGLKGKSYQ